MAKAMKGMTRSSYCKISEGGIKGWLREEVFRFLPPRFFQDPISATLEMDGKVLKQSRLRWAAIFTLSDQRRIFLKKDKTKGWVESLKYLILPSKARKEWFTATEIKRRGLSIPRPLGWLEREHQGFVKESYYFSEAIGSGASLIDQCGELGDRFPLFELSKTVRKFHESGLFHKDLHAGNFIWDGESLFLTDLHNAVIVKKLSLEKRLWNLSHLFHSLRSIWGRREHTQFLEEYFREGVFRVPKKEETLQRIYTGMDRLQKRQWKSRTKRCLKESTEFSAQRERGSSYYYRKDFPLEILKKKVGEHLRLLSESRSALVKSSPEVTISILEHDERKLSVKNYRPVKTWGRFKEHFRRSKGLKAWVAGNGLRARGIPSLKPLGLVERRDWSGLRESFFVMDVLDGSQELDRYVLTNVNDFKKRRRFIEVFAQWLSRYHTMDLYHKDMKTCNILVAEGGESWGFHLLDLEDVRLEGKVSEKELFKNFLQLNTSTPKSITTVDRFRFLEEYLRLNPIVKDRKSFLRRLIDESRRRGLVYVSPQGVVVESL